uniref:Uncharacterized protein n=1 Tax=Panagrolaimus davidi TaxID=227884 RepID=A0A914PMT1_9BILA
MSEHSRQQQFQTPSPSGTPLAALPEKSTSTGTEKSKTQFYSIVQPAPLPSEPPTTLHTPPGPYEIVAPSMMTNNAAVVAALEGKCEFPKNKMIMNLAKDINERGQQLEKQPYYVGMLNADHVAVDKLNLC